MVYLAFACVADDDPGLFRALLAEAGRRLEGRGVHCLLTALHEGHPLARTRLGGLAYHSRMYLVCWDDGLARCRALLSSGGPFHVEAATL